MKQPAAFGAAASFLTPFGGGRTAPPPEAVAWFPVVGGGIGLATGTIWRAATGRLGPLVGASLAFAADAGITGALHLDGLADAADGLLAHASETDRLAIMAEPQIGTFGAVVLGSVIAVRIAALGSLAPSPAALGALGAASRSVVAIATRALPYARPGGLAHAFLPDTSPGAGPDRAVLAGLAGLVASFAAASATHGRRGAVALVAGPLAGGAVLAFARRRLGGYTGDVLGASAVVCETVGLVVLAGSSRR